MANYNLVVNTSSFKPYDILGMYLPILTAEKNQYDKNVESLDKIAIENGLYIPPDGKYKDMKDLYTADLMDIASKVSNGELSTRAVNDIRRRYYKDIVPIDKAAEAYNKYLDKLTALGPDAIIGNRSTFDDFYGGKNQAIEYRSGKEIQRVAAGVTLGLDNALMKAPEKAGAIARQYFILRQRGLDGELALSDILSNNRMDQLTAEGAGQLVLALDKVYNTFSKDTFSDDAKGKIWENTVLGAILGIQAPKYSLQADHSYESDAQRASREYTETQTAYYRTSKELDEMKKWQDLGYIPKTDELGNIVRDNNGNILYEQNIEEAARRKKALGTSTRTTLTLSQLPKDYLEFTGSDGKKYAIKSASGRRIDPIIYALDESGEWTKLPADDVQLRLRIENEAKGLLRPSRTPKKDEEENKPENPYKPGLGGRNPAS